MSLDASSVPSPIQHPSPLVTGADGRLSLQGAPSVRVAILSPIPSLYIGIALALAYALYRRIFV